MRIIIVSIAASLVFAGVSNAKDMKSCNADWKAAKATATLKHKDFMSTCMKGDTSVSQVVTTKPSNGPAVTTTTAAPAPMMRQSTVAPGSAPAGASAQCKDGSYSMSKHHSGTCSHHGGVAKFMQ